jgi:hypothetical protein
MPNTKDIEVFLRRFESKYGFSFDSDLNSLSSSLKGNNYGDIENFALSVMRRYILSLPEKDVKRIVREELRELSMTVNGK